MTDANSVTKKNFKIRADDFITFGFKTLYRIEAMCDIPERGVKKGDVGGYVEGAYNLADNAWIYDDAKVFGAAVVCGDAEARGNSWIYGRARVSGNSRISGDVRVCDDATVCGNVVVKDEAFIGGHAHVCDDSVIKGSARIFMGAKITGKSEVSDCSIVVEKQHIKDGVIADKIDRLAGTPNVHIFSDIYQKNVAVKTICTALLVAGLCQKQR